MNKKRFISRRALREACSITAVVAVVALFAWLVSYGAGVATGTFMSVALSLVTIAVLLFVGLVLYPFDVAEFVREGDTQSLLRGLRHKDPNLVAAASDALAQMSPVSSRVLVAELRRLLQATREQNHVLGNSAKRYVGNIYAGIVRIGVAEDLGALVPIISSGPSAGGYWPLMGPILPTISVERLLQAANHSDPVDVAKAVLRRILYPLELGNKLSLRELDRNPRDESILGRLDSIIAALEDPSERVRDAASGALILAGPSTIPVCKSVFARGSKQAGTSACKVLASFGEYIPSGWPTPTLPPTPGVGELLIENASDYVLRVAVIERDTPGAQRGVEAWVGCSERFYLSDYLEFVLYFYDCGDPFRKYVTAEYVRIRRGLKIRFPSKSESGIKISASSA